MIREMLTDLQRQYHDRTSTRNHTRRYLDDLLDREDWRAKLVADADGGEHEDEARTLLCYIGAKL